MRTMPCFPDGCGMEPRQGPIPLARVTREITAAVRASSKAYRVDLTPCDYLPNVMRNPMGPQILAWCQLISPIVKIALPVVSPSLFGTFG